MRSFLDLSTSSSTRSAASRLDIRGISTVEPSRRIMVATFVSGIASFLVFCLAATLAGAGANYAQIAIQRTAGVGTCSPTLASFQLRKGDEVDRSFRAKPLVNRSMKPGAKRFTLRADGPAPLPRSIVSSTSLECFTTHTGAGSTKLKRSEAPNFATKPVLSMVNPGTSGTSAYPNRPKFCAVERQATTSSSRLVAEARVKQLNAEALRLP